MEDMVARCGFDAKVVNHKTEADVMSHVAPQARCVLAMVVPICIESLFE
jgi:hypothetical protein